MGYIYKYQTHVDPYHLGQNEQKNVNPESGNKQKVNKRFQRKYNLHIHSQF